MNETVKPGEDVKANIERVNALTNHLYQALNEWIEANPTTSLIDVFMAGHSFHKVVVTNVAVQWAKGDIPIEKTFKMAEATFRKSMRELWRLALSASG